MDETDRVIRLERRNNELQNELTDVQDKLSTSRAERDDIGIKYNALTDRLDRMMKPGEETLALEAGTSRSISAARADPGRATAIDTIGRGRRLEEENQAFRRRLETYQESQRQQAQVVTKLQDKVQQYKQRCGQLEERMTDSGRRLAAADQRTQERLQTTADRDHALDLETALVRLEEAENRCVTLSDVNSLLREQLDAAQEANEALTGEIQKLTGDWQRLRDEMEHKEHDWQEEEQTFNEYYNAEHARMLKLWKEIVGFRRDFSDLKLGTERDLGRVRSEMSRLARQTADACSTVHSSGSGADQTDAAAGSSSVPAVRKQVSQMSAAFSKGSMFEKMQDIQKQETTFRAKKREMDIKIKDLSNQLDMARSESVEKEKMVVSLNKMVHTLESSTAELIQKLETSRHVSEENDVLSQAIREVAQLVVDDSERGPEADDKVSVLVKSTSLSSTDLKAMQPDPGPPDPDPGLPDPDPGRVLPASEPAAVPGQIPTPAPRQGSTPGQTQDQTSSRTPLPGQTPAPPPVSPRGILRYMTGLAWRSPTSSSTNFSPATPSSPVSPSTPVPRSNRAPLYTPAPPFSPGSVPVQNAEGYMTGLVCDSRDAPVTAGVGYMTGPGGAGHRGVQPSPAADAAAAAPATPAGYMGGLAWRPATDPVTPLWEAATPRSGDVTPLPAQSTYLSGGVSPLPTQSGVLSENSASDLARKVGSSSATPVSGGATPVQGVASPGWSVATPGSDTVTPGSGVATPGSQSDAAGWRGVVTPWGPVTPPWEVATPGSVVSGAASPVQAQTSRLPGSILPVLPPGGVPSLQAPSWPEPGMEMESGAGAGAGSEPQPLSRPSTGQRPRPEPEPRLRPVQSISQTRSLASDDLAAVSSCVPSAASATSSETSCQPPPGAEKTSSPSPEAGLEVATVVPTGHKGGCCAVS